MQINTLTQEQLAETLAESNVLEVIDNGPLRTYVAEHHGQDILIFEASGAITVVYPCTMLDAESGGSVHSIARACLAD
jgi:hypothetical protein